MIVVTCEFCGDRPAVTSMDGKSSCDECVDDAVARGEYEEDDCE